ncbi:hypothetical protein GMA8713_05130 [Grimontia marina]|uniref:Uncharacterized protein n=1 Tax=Grimontia marina TaxID=646534 RepID=A0A128FJV9_9GAMM|nr:hypothetical protein GMA8713_05130 [Grimontia marina]
MFKIITLYLFNRGKESGRIFGYTLCFHIININPEHVMMLNQAVPSLFKPPNIDVLTIQLDQIMGTTVEWQSR